MLNESGHSVRLLVRSRVYSLTVLLLTSQQWDDEVHRYGNGFSTADLVGGALNKTREALDVLFDVDILSRCAGVCVCVCVCVCRCRY
jgi:hypothetical protein